MPSRRTLVIAGAGAVVAGLAALEARRHPNLWRRLGLDRSPDHRVPDHHVATRSGTLASVRLGRPVRWKLSLPPERAATVFCLHGRGGNEESPFGEQHLPDVAAALGLPLAFVGVDGGDHSYWHPRHDGTDSLGMLLDELIPLAETLTGTSRRLLMGWSMGGYGALLAAETAPERFAGVAALSPALWRAPRETARGAFDDEADFHRHDVFAGRARLARTGVFLACGTGDPFHAATGAFAGELSRVETAFGPGYHDPPYWRSVAPQALRFLAKQ